MFYRIYKSPYCCYKRYYPPPWPYRNFYPMTSIIDSNFQEATQKAANTGTITGLNQNINQTYLK